jgi:hypothetical protein
MRLPFRILLAAIVSAFALAPVAAFAIGDGTPDESPPAEETACDAAGLGGAAYGLCVAYCEANDCDVYPDSQACDRLWENYTKITGEEFFPCEEVGPPSFAP